MFGTIKFRHLLDKKNPAISTFTDTQTIKNEYEYYVDENKGFKIAVGLNNYRKGVLNDPRYIRWVARVYQWNGDHSVQQYYPLNQCGLSDMAKFYPVQDRAKWELNELLEKDAFFA